MPFAANSFVTTVANGGSIYAAAMVHPRGVVAYENGNAGGADALGATGPGPVSVGGRLYRAGNGQIGLSYLTLVAQVTCALAVKQASATALVGATDCGHFWTGQVATANLCNLPSNFGPGAGNWVQADILKLRVSRRFIPSAAAIEVGSVEHFSTTLAAGNITIAFKNCSLGISGPIEVDLHYMHSIEA